MPLFSIVIPVYMVEKYINECVDSILRQDYSDYEIILVDDCSPDNSGEICDKYAESDKRIRVIRHELNIGASGARNSGIRSAHGKYILFLDGDDFFLDGNLKAISDRLLLNQDVDVMFLSMAKCRLSNKTYKISNWKSPLESDFQADFNRQRCECEMNSYSQRSGLKTNDEILEIMLKGHLYNPSPGSKLVKRELIIHYSLFFNENITAEDLPWTFELLLKARSYLVCEAGHYVYRMRTGSTTHSKAGKYRGACALTEFVSGWAEYCKDESNINREIYLCQLAYQYSIVMGMLYYLTRDERQLLAAKLKPLAWVLRYSNQKKTLLTKTVYKIFGFWLCSFILYIFLRFKDVLLYLSEIFYDKRGD